ncbi:hypothetical protein HID58_076273 [Brassica napus]|uniref:Uncharacterized protein n=1 Tax=Brassica napus TaxID=3708 RepID=A0ABQ7YM77_BRANA|nr:hypothetical protein HID58_076273 [Brassica napus]
MSNETKDLNNYHFTSSYDHYNSINSQSIMNLAYLSGPSTYNANMISSQIGSDLHSCPRGACGLGFELSPSSTEFFNSSIDQENDFYNAYNYNTSHKSHEVVGGGGAIVESETKVSASPSSSEHHHGEDSGKSLMKREADDGGKDIGQLSDFIINTPRTFSHDGLFRVPYASMNVNANYEQQQSQEFHHESDYELLKEMFPSVFLKQEP